MFHSVQSREVHLELSSLFDQFYLNEPESPLQVDLPSWPDMQMMLGLTTVGYCFIHSIFVIVSRPTSLNTELIPLAVSEGLPQPVAST